MSTTLITACEGIPSEVDQVVVSAAAVPFLLAAGWVRESEAPTVTVHRMLATTPAPVVPNMEDDDYDFGEPNPCSLPREFVAAYLEEA